MVLKSELIAAIYEVGQCYSKAWGVKEDKKMAVVSFERPLPIASDLSAFYSQSYFHIAARLGDAGAQEELGFCYANGRGCKKDKKEAAKWYRLAVSLLTQSRSVPLTEVSNP